MLNCLSVTAQKRGLAYGHHSWSDLQILTPEISWWYNWSEQPETSAGDYSDLPVEFVPMTWNGQFDENKLRGFLDAHPETRYLLTFNEPNFIEQANMTPSEVAAIWPQLESIADKYELELVGPAVNYCGTCVSENGTTYYDPFIYLDDFFAACEGCRVDHIAVHSYMNSIGAFSWFISEFERYGKPIWVTEFAGWEQNGNVNNVDDQISFMMGAVDYLESNPQVVKYSWFIGRGDGISNYPHIDILGNTGTLTALGEVYKNMPVHDENFVVDIPARIEAESYNLMSGILLERTLDESGFANVGYIESGDWLEYKISVPESKTYNINFRIAAAGNTGFEFLVDDNLALTQNITNTGGWQSWTTLTNEIDLTAGEHTIKILAKNSGFNINWFEIGEIIINSIPESPNLTLYPNPAYETLNLSFNDNQLHELKLLDYSGKQVLALAISGNEVIDVSRMPNGIYLLDIDNGDQYRRVIIR